MAARGACAAAGKAADHRYSRLGLCRMEPLGLCSHAAAARARLCRESHRCDRVSLGRGPRRTLRGDGCRARRAEGRHYRCAGNAGDRRGEESNSRHSHRLSHRVRAGRRRLGRFTGATWRQCHRPVDNPILPANGSKFCGKSSPVSADWRCWRTATVLSPS